jgi:hypothetical protein
MIARAHRRAKRAGAKSRPYSPEQLQQQIERLRRENEELRRKVAERDQQMADAEKQIADLERQLALRKRNSTNSSKPPCSDGLAGDQRPRGRPDKSKRKPGGQPGHHRPLVPSAEVSAVEVLLPKHCQH